MAVLSFGVVTQAMLAPQAELDVGLIQNVTRRPYFQMYGELFLEDYEGMHISVHIYINVFLSQSKSFTISPINQSKKYGKANNWFQLSIVNNMCTNGFLFRQHEILTIFTEIKKLF